MSMSKDKIEKIIAICKEYGEEKVIENLNKRLKEIKKKDDYIPFKKSEARTDNENYKDVVSEYHSRMKGIKQTIDWAPDWESKSMKIFRNEIVIAEQARNYNLTHGDLVHYWNVQEALIKAGRKDVAIRLSIKADGTISIYEGRKIVKPQIKEEEEKDLIVDIEDLNKELKPIEKEINEEMIKEDKECLVTAEMDDNNESYEDYESDAEFEINLEE